MPVAAVIAVVGAVTAVVGTVAAISSQKKAAKQSKKAARYERQKSEMSAARERMQAIKAGRQAKGYAMQAAENQGVSSSSGAQGGQGSIDSQTGGNISFLDQYGYASDMASRHGQKAANYMGDANMWGAVASAGKDVMNTAAGFMGPAPPKG